MIKEELFESGVPVDCYTPHDAAILYLAIQANELDYYWNEHNDGRRVARFYLRTMDLEVIDDLKRIEDTRRQNERASTIQYEYEVTRHFNWVG